MTLAREIVQDAAVGVGVTDRPEGLSAIHRPGCAAAIWRRQPLPDFQSWIDALEPKQLPKARVILRPDDPSVMRFFQICEASGMPDCPETGKAGRMTRQRSGGHLCIGLMGADRVCGCASTSSRQTPAGNSISTLLRRVSSAPIAGRARNTASRPTGPSLDAFSPFPPVRRSCCAARCGRSARNPACCTAHRPLPARARRALSSFLIR